MAAPHTSAEAWATIIVAVATLVTAVAALLKVRSSHRRIETIEDTLNHTDSEVTTPDGVGIAPTLGQRVVMLQRSVDQGFERNDETHAAIFDALHAVTRRDDAIEGRVEHLEWHIHGPHATEGGHVAPEEPHD